MKALSVKPEFVSLLKSGEFDTFSVPRFRDAYQELVGETSKSKRLISRQVIRHLRKLEEWGVLERIDTGKAIPLKYRIKNPALLDPQSCDIASPSKLTMRTAEPAGNEAFLVLKTKLNTYRTDLLSATGELEEYEAIALTQPDLKDAIQKKYDETRDEYAKTLGKVRALESLIDLHICR